MARMVVFGLTQSAFPIRIESAGTRRRSLWRSIVPANLSLAGMIPSGKTVRLNGRAGAESSSALVRVFPLRSGWAAGSDGGTLVWPVRSEAH